MAELDPVPGVDGPGRSEPPLYAPPQTGKLPQVERARPPQLRPLSEDMAARNRKSKGKKKSGSDGGGWFRNPFAKQGPGAVGPPPNPWVAASVSAAPPTPADTRRSLAPTPAGAPAAEQAGGEGSRKRKQKKAPKVQEPDAGWFRNPFAKPQTSAKVGRDQVSPAQMWSGPRRGILVRRVLGVIAVLLLFFLAVNIGKKVNKSDVDAMVAKKVKAAGVSFPRGAAVMWAAPLVKTFATYDEDFVQQRSQALAPYAVNGIDEQMGWNGSGKQTVLDMVMSNDVQVADSSHAVVSATVQVQDGSWRCLAVPLYMVKRGRSTAFGLTSAPVYQPCQGLTSPPQGNRNSAPNDTGLASTFKSELLPPFMAAWAQGDSENLARYLLPGVKSFGLGGAYTGSDDGGRPQIGDVYVPSAKAGDPDHRTVTFTVSLLGLDGKAVQQSTYQVEVQRRNGQWYFAGDPAAAVDQQGVGGDSVPQSKPTSGTGEMYSHTPAPLPPDPSKKPGGSASAQPSPSSSKTKGR
ncbi:conjugal transfer protein [Wenjunlia tyrosinilytica]|nr:conjugal transfer protein [Wenjunlia tyrosinilytica]